MKLLHKASKGRVQHEITPANTGWQHLSFAQLNLQAGESHSTDSAGEELLLVFLSGSATVRVAQQSFEIAGRQNVFASLPHTLYVPPNTPFTVFAHSPLEFAWGGAPATGKCAVRAFGPSDFRVEARGGANVSRRVTHVLSPDVHGEHLFVFEVYTPSGNWSGFPPHRHDGRMGSTYLEETYLFKIAPKNGFGSMRIYTKDSDLDELILVQDNDLVLVPEGYHPSNAAPGSNMYFLNFLAGPGQDYTVVNDPDYDWIKDDWQGKPIFGPNAD